MVSDRRRLMNWDQFWLTNAQFSRIEPQLPADARGKPRVDERRVMWEHPRSQVGRALD
jgi:hypothetical protein